ncbi:uncharacterized protein LOC110702833 [Chenopodium quinoa]|uniref:uncharacterized protein LOC110702833 n=1 Tax=Chenopodium quinoa TaxID=63459 RepID=UPI000B78FABB|nr:uncharacterized protein LOC110702833 [Chenopodium quinoa]
MRKASHVAPGLVVSFLGTPADSIMMQFGLNESNTLGDLVFIYKAEKIVFNSQDKKESSSEEGAGSGSEEVNISDSEHMDFQPDELEYLGFSVGPSGSSLAESSNPIPEKVIDFKLKPASRLLNSVFAISNSEFNPTGMGRVDIAEIGFEITVRNTETGVPANLHLNPSGLIDFHCSKPIVGKFINVNNIFLVLVGVSHDDDIVTIFHLDGSDDLTFILGSSPDEEYKVKLLELDAEVEKIPDITLFSEAVLTSDVLRRMITQLEETGITQQACWN